MKHGKMKLAAAAMVIAATGIGIKYFGGGLDGSTVAWADVVEQISSHTQYKCRQKVVRENGPPIPVMDIYHLNLSQRRQEVEDGSLHIIDMRGEDAITVELYPKEKKATVTRLVGFGPRKDPDIIEMVKQFSEKSTEKLGTKAKDGRTLYGFHHQPNEHNDFIVWADAKTKLPVEIELKHVKRGQTLYLDEFEFDFELDPSAFSTEIPEGYEVKTIVQDCRPVEVREITPREIRRELNHTAYTVKTLPWMEKITVMQARDPLMQSGKVYLTGIRCEDGNRIIIGQSNTQHDYKEAMMEWMGKEEVVLTTPGGAKLYTHPNGAEYARLFLECFAQASPEFFVIEDLHEERFARMILMPDGTIIGLSVNRQIEDSRLRQLVESLTEIQAD
ncbi:MAG: hypothetical protein JW828_04995 [Sedimentisphaerales bacterium]|nr:hypothetical protein [Sedimentisphaerales bacterium]